MYHIIILNFLTEKILKYHEKKLKDALQKLQLHQDRKKHLEAVLETTDNESKIDIEEEIGKQNEFIGIWENNIEKINEQLKKLQN